MILWLQNLLVLALVLACATFIGWQIVQSLRGKASRAGSCCAKGCASEPQQARKRPAKRVVFMPVEMLGRRKP
jgi:hypothetical protein